MEILKIQNINLKNKRVFVRFDFNVPFDRKWNISDYTRVNAALETIEYLLKQNCSIIIASHLWRPTWYQKQFSLEPVQKTLRALLRWPVKLANWVCDEETIKTAQKLKSKEILLLENLRFEKGEKQNSEEFSKKLASMAEIYINDAFWVSHRQHSSVYGITNFFPDNKKGLGLLVQKEVSYLKKVMNNPNRPFVAIVGWSKISSKLEAVKQLLSKVDKIIIGWAMAFTFLKAQWYQVWRSLVENYLINEAKDILETMGKQGKELILPVDFVASNVFWKGWNMKTVSYKDIPKDLMWLDIWEESIKLFFGIDLCEHMK